MTILTQAEADALIACEKHVEHPNKRYAFQKQSVKLVIPLLSPTHRENFTLDISRHHINILKGKYQNRVRGNIPLVRLDFGNKPHRNPDNEKISCPHLHLYREGYDLRWAYPIDPTIFTNTSDLWLTLHEFMTYTNITQIPLFSSELNLVSSYE